MLTQGEPKGQRARIFAPALRFPAPERDGDGNRAERISSSPANQDTAGENLCLTLPAETWPLAARATVVPWMLSSISCRLSPTLPSRGQGSACVTQHRPTFGRNPHD